MDEGRRWRDKLERETRARERRGREKQKVYSSHEFYIVVAPRSGV